MDSIITILLDQTNPRDTSLSYSLNGCAFVTVFHGLPSDKPLWPAVTLYAGKVAIYDWLWDTRNIARTILCVRARYRKTQRQFEGKISALSSLLVFLCELPDNVFIVFFDYLKSTLTPANAHSVRKEVYPS